MTQVAILDSPSTPQQREEAHPQRRLLAAETGVWKQFKESTFDRVRLLERSVLALRAGSLSEDERQQAVQAAHRLARSVGTFGFPHGSQLARQIVIMLHPGVPLSQAQISHLSELVVALWQELERSPTDLREDPAELNLPQPRLLVVDSNTDQAERIAIEAWAQGLWPEIATDLTSARQAVKRQRPDVVLLETTLPTGTADGFTLLAELTQQTPPIPVLVFTVQDTFADRVQVARLGGHGFLQKPMPPALVLEAVTRTLRPDHRVETTVLAVDDDPVVLDILEASLQPHGMTLIALDNPTRFWEVLAECSPDLLILDMQMPTLSGLDLCRVVRNEPRWRELPIIFLTAYTDTDIIQRGYAAGADEFISKPILGPALVSRITNRLERTRQLRSMGENDPLTGLTTRYLATRTVYQFLRLADRQQQPLSLCCLDLDHMRPIIDAYGRASRDEVLQRLGRLLLPGSFRGEDIVARWSEEEFVVGMYGATKEASRKSTGRGARSVPSAGILRIGWAAIQHKLQRWGRTVPARRGESVDLVSGCGTGTGAS